MNKCHFKKDREESIRFTIHTDGSYNHITNNGAGAYIIIDNLSGQIKQGSVEYPNACGSTDVELNTIFEAMENIPECEAKKPRIKILTDSLTSVKAINSYIDSNAQSALSEKFNETQRNILEKFKIVAGHEQGHNNINFNEICDAFATHVRKQMDQQLMS